MNEPEEEKTEEKETPQKINEIEQMEEEKEKKVRQFRVEEKEILDELDKVILEAKERKKQVVNSIEVLNNPRKVTKAFLRDRRRIPKLIARIRKKPLPIQKELQEPLLEIIKENGYSETIEGVKAGDFLIQTAKGEKTINLTPDKLIAWKYGDRYYKKWYAYENNMTPYPEDPVHNQKSQSKK